MLVMVVMVIVVVVVAAATAVLIVSSGRVRRVRKAVAVAVLGDAAGQRGGNGNGIHLSVGANKTSGRQAGSSGALG